LDRTSTWTKAQFVERDVPSGTINLLTSVDEPLALPALDKVIYAYDVNGNLAQVTNEIGQITKIISVDKEPADHDGPICYRRHCCFMAWSRFR
jgi:hypothetical protein